jgi:hypothetical protein
MLNKKILGFTLVIVSILVATGCYQDRVVPASAQVVVITKDVHFTTDVAPIFAKSCALSGCHASGGHKPDLSSGSAYSSLTSGNYLSTGSPETSEIYQWLSGKRGTQMPPNGLDPAINATILAWIKQGAKND